MRSPRCMAWASATFSMSSSPCFPSQSRKAESSRRPSPKDRRAQLVRLTAEGRRFFRAMARTNGDWIGEIFAGLSADDIEALLRLLAKTKASAHKAIGSRGPR